LQVGGSGQWRFQGITNCDYKYLIYTPLEGFEETAVIGKVLLQDGVDVDLRVRVSQVKVNSFSSFFNAEIENTFEME